jgi:hypothetical protein
MPIVRDAATKTFVGFAGSGTYLEGAKQDAWSFSPASGAWTKIAADNGAPAPRYCHCVALLPDQHQLLVVGGRDTNGALAPNGWTLDLATNAWTQVQGDAPPGVVGCHATWMPNVKRAIVFGGEGPRGLSPDTWAYDPSARAFTKLAPAASPPARRDGAAAYDPGGRMLLWSGSTIVYPPEAAKQLDDLWAFDGTTWTELHPDGARPPPRRVPAVAFDPAHRKWLVVGGTVETKDLGDVWTLDVATLTWTQYADDKAPSARGFASGEYDPDGDAYYVFGGFTQPAQEEKRDAYRLELR